MEKVWKLGVTMDKEFELAVYAYCEYVRRACDSLIQNINSVEQKNIHDKFDLFSYIRKNLIFEYVLDDRKYCFHGSGCSVHADDEIIVDWDFGYKNLWCGIDPYKMARTLRNNKYENTIFYEADYIRNLCDLYFSQNILIKYGNQYYIDYLKKGTKEIVLPSCFDSLIIQYSGKQKSFPRTKIIDKFFRKSKFIYKDIDKLENNYILIFMDKGDEVSRMFYNDVAYPDAAVELMNTQILKPHIVSD